MLQKCTPTAMSTALCALRPVTLSLLIWISLIPNHLNASSSTMHNFAFIPKSLDNPFFNDSRVGCMDAARLYGVQCLWIAPEKEDAELQANLTLDLIREGRVDGLAISVVSIDLMTPVIAKSVQAGIPVVTFDSDAPDSARSVYIGTDNYFFGGELGKVLDDLVPMGGNYAVVAGSAPNLQLRAKAVLSYLNGLGKWKQLPNSPSDSKGDPLTALQQIQEFAKQKPTSIVSVLGAPMFNRNEWETFVQENDSTHNITLVCADSLPIQLELLQTAYVDGLVGQLPYEMGFHAIEELLSIKNGVPPEEEIVGTNVLIHLRVPLVLPKLVVNNNLIGSLKYVGYILFGIVTVAALVFALWTWKNRNARVVTVSQPVFLIMVASGVFIMASSLLPISFDDSGRSACDTDRCTAVCMSVPWLGFLGFTLTFTALFAKTWRINRIFKTKLAFGRVKITARDVLPLLAILLSANAIILTCWTALDPLVYIRKPLDGMDGWNRVIATYGSCHSRNVAVYLIPLAVLNLGVMLVANWQAFAARTIRCEFSESKYIAMAIGSMLQAAFIGIPTLFVVRKSPAAYYLILTFMLFVVCMAVLMLIFIPKIVIHQNFQKLSATEQRRLIRNSIYLSGSTAIDSNGSIQRIQRRSQLFPEPVANGGRRLSGAMREVVNNLHHLQPDGDGSMLAFDSSHDNYIQSNEANSAMDDETSRTGALDVRQSDSQLECDP